MIRISRDFCELLVSRIGNSAGLEEEEQLGLIETDDGSWVDTVARLLVKVPPPLPSEDLSIQRKGTENFR